MPHNDFDESLRDRLQDYSSPVSTESWKRIRAGWVFDRTARLGQWLAAAIVIGALLMMTLPIGLSDSPLPVATLPTATTTRTTITNTPITHTIPGVNHPNIVTPASGSQPDGITGAGYTKAKLNRQTPNPNHPTGTLSTQATISAPDPISAKSVTSASSAPTTPSAVTSNAHRIRFPVNLAALRLSKNAITAGPPKHQELKCPMGPEPIHHRVNLDLFASPDFVNGWYNGFGTAGIHISVYLSEKFFITTGLQYSRIRPPRLNSNDSLNYFLRLSHYNLHNLDLPLLIGYTLSSGQNIVSVTGGVLLNLHSHLTDPYLQSYWPHHISPSAWLGIDIAHRFNNHFSFFAQPYGRYYFNPNPLFFAKPTYIEGALIGIRYEFIRR